MFFEIIDFEHPAKWFEHEIFFLLKKNIVEQESSIYNSLLPNFYPSPENLSFKQSFQHKSWLFPRLTGEG